MVWSCICLVHRTTPNQGQYKKVLSRKAAKEKNNWIEKAGLSLSRSLRLGASNFSKTFLSQHNPVEIIQLDNHQRLFLGPEIDDWKPLDEHGISAVIDLDGDLDIGVPTVPNHLLYIYFPIQDGELPDLEKLHAVAKLGADLVKNGHRVLSHCGLGFNRSALVAGLILNYLGMTGKEVVSHLRERRPGALFNETFASYLESLPSQKKG